MAIKSIPSKWLRFITTLACMGLTALFLWCWVLPQSVQINPIAEFDTSYAYYSFLSYFNTLFSILLVICALTGFLLAFIRPLALGRGFCSRIPVEFALPSTLFVVAASLELLPDLIFAVRIGNVEEALSYLFPYAMAQFLVFIAMLLGMLAAPFVLFELCAALGAGLRDGFGHYLRRRCLVVRFICWVAERVSSFFRRFAQVDLSKPLEWNLFKLVLLVGIGGALCCAGWLFGILGVAVGCSALFLWLRRRALRLQRQYELLLRAARRMAEGELDSPIQEDAGPFNPLREQLNAVQAGFSQAVEEEVRSRNMKTELITNVSHDLKTPLTAIISYVDLLKDDALPDETRREYIATLDKKSQRLKRLIEDLFEMSKAASGAVVMHYDTVDLIALLKQVQYELEDRTSACGVEFRWQLPEGKVLLPLDGQKTCRIFENLVANITKYALPGTRAYIRLETADGRAKATFKNVSATELESDASRLAERFVRGDSSRNTEGSGLGLAIAKSFAELQGGAFALEVDDDLFKVEVSFPLPAVQLDDASSAYELPAAL